MLFILYYTRIKKKEAGWTAKIQAKQNISEKMAKHTIEAEQEKENQARKAQRI